MSTYRNHEDLANLSREELLAKLQAEIEKNQSLTKVKHDKTQGSARDHELLGLLLEGPKTGAELATAMDCSKENVASYLSYLRKDGCVIRKDLRDNTKHRLYMVNDNAAPYVKRMAAEANFVNINIG